MPRPLAFNRPVFNQGPGESAGFTEHDGGREYVVDFCQDLLQAIVQAESHHGRSDSSRNQLGTFVSSPCPFNLRPWILPKSLNSWKLNATPSTTPSKLSGEAAQPGEEVSGRCRQRPEN